MKHFLNGIQISPRNIGEIGIISDFTNRPDELELNVSTIVLTREAFNIVKDFILQKGFFEGLPYYVQSSSGITIDYYVDLQESPVFRDFEVEVKIKKRFGKDSFREQASGTSFELMVKKGVSFNPFDLPYIIVKDNQAELALTLAISLYVMGKELIDQVKILISTVTDLIGAVTPNVGLGVTFDVGDIIGLVLKVVAQIAFVALMITAIIKLGQQLFDLIFPKIRYLKATKVKELIEKGCNFLNYSFKSTLLDNLSALTILPVPLKKQSKKWFEFTQNELNQSFNKGYPTASDTTPTLMSLIEAMENTLYAEMRIINNVVYLENDSYWQNISQNSINTAMNLQNERDNEYTVNTLEAWKRLYIHYVADITDLHTYDDFEGNEAEYSTEPLGVDSQELITISGLNEVSIPFAMGKRKDKLNWLEERVKELFDVIDEVSSVFGGGTSLASKIENRKGVLMLSQQYFQTTKLLYTIGGKQPQNYLNYISAGALYNKFHYLSQIQLRGAKIYQNARVLMNDEQFQNLLINNYADINGDICEILRVEFLDIDTSSTGANKSMATISYKKPYNYASGKVQTITINN